MTKCGNTIDGIAQSPFMLEKAKTNAFEMNVSVKCDELYYNEVTSLRIHGRGFQHVDGRELFSVTYEQG